VIKDEPQEVDPVEAAEALIASGRAAQAADGLRARLAAGRGGALAQVTLIKALLASEDIPDALVVAREAALLHPNVAPVQVALGQALLAAENLPTAIAELQRALRLDPECVHARELIAQAWLRAGEAGKALEILSALAATPQRAAMIARAQAILAADRSDPGYVRHLFDQFSSDYDNRMRGHLSYAAPEILRSLFDLVMPGRDQLTILDLGCGTGLAGEVFKALALRLDGMDLSPAMIEKARARGIYDRLIVADLEPGMGQLGLLYDLVLAADTLVYLGDLVPVFRAAAARLANDGYFLFTVEQADGDEFELGPKRRWRHAEAYLRAAAAQTGLCVAGLVAATPRREANVPVEGFAVALAK
jgi:predicted TPR repeat methyltransferase